MPHNEIIELNVIADLDSICFCYFLVLPFFNTKFGTWMSLHVNNKLAPIENLTIEKCGL